MTVKNISINSEHAGRRIDNFLMTILSNIPKSNIYKIIRKGEVRVNSKRIKPSFKLSEGDLVRIPPKINETKKNNLNVDSDFFENNPIIFEDDECLILNSKDYSLLFVEVNSSGVNDTLWSYKFKNEISIKQIRLSWYRQ